jgi:hypothetical protein
VVETRHTRAPLHADLFGRERAAGLHLTAQDRESGEAVALQAGAQEQILREGRRWFGHFDE